MKSTFFHNQEGVSTADANLNPGLSSGEKSPASDIEKLKQQFNVSSTPSLAYPNIFKKQPKTNPNARNQLKLLAHVPIEVLLTQKIVPNISDQDSFKTTKSVMPLIGLEHSQEPEQDITQIDTSEFQLNEILNRNPADVSLSQSLFEHQLLSDNCLSGNVFYSVPSVSNPETQEIQEIKDVPIFIKDLIVRPELQSILLNEHCYIMFDWQQIPSFDKDRAQVNSFILSFNRGGTSLNTPKTYPPAFYNFKATTNRLDTLITFIPNLLYSPNGKKLADKIKEEFPEAEVQFQKCEMDLKKFDVNSAINAFRNKNILPIQEHSNDGYAANKRRRQF